MPEFKGNNATSCRRICGHIAETDGSRIGLGTVKLELDMETAYALCNVLSEKTIIEHNNLDTGQRPPLIKLGQAIALYCGHDNASIK